MVLTVAIPGSIQNKHQEFSEATYTTVKTKSLTVRFLYLLIFLNDQGSQNGLPGGLPVLEQLRSKETFREWRFAAQVLHTFQMS